MMTTDDNKGPNPWLTLTAVCFGGFMAAMDTSIVNIILPALVKAFDTEFSWVQWVSMGYLFTVTVLILSFGKIGDIVGRKKMYLIGLFIFLAGSLLCGAAGSVHWLIGFRILQGLGGAMIMALGFAIVTSVFPENLRGRALGIIGAVVSCGVISGPVLGGLLTRMYSWHWVFWVNLPVGILGIVMVAYHVPDNQVPPPIPLTIQVLLSCFWPFCLSWALLPWASRSDSPPSRSWA